MVGTARAILYVALLLAGIVAYTLLFFPALDLIAPKLEVEQVEKAHAAAPWEKGEPPCFFAGRPLVFTQAACGGRAGTRTARWHVYCEPDPDCMEFPDGTSYVEEMAP
jgi:hypothetical protein